MLPGKIEALGKRLVVPFTRMRLGKMVAGTDPILTTGGTKVPYEVSKALIKKINAAGFGGYQNFSQSVKGDPAAAMRSMGKLNSSNSELLKNILNSIVVRDGKYYYRTKDSMLNSLKEIKGGDVDDFVKNFPGEDITKLLLYNTHRGAVPTTQVIAEAARMTGSKIPRELVVTDGGSFFSSPTSLHAAKDSMVINNPRLTAPSHEFLHEKDYQNSLRRAIPQIGRGIAATSLIGTPVSLLYGDKLSSIIPGTVDDKIINTLKAVGPEIFLAGSAIQHSPEIYANKHTKNMIKNNPSYFGGMSKLMGGPSDVQDLVDIQDVKARSYPSGILTNYGLLRLGTLPMLLSKNAALSSPGVSAADYGGTAVGVLSGYLNAMKGLARGVRDKNVIQGLLYHDSANKYKSIPTIVSPALLASMIPIIALDQYMSSHKKPSPAKVADYGDSIKQGLGA